jgi:hypothetical protein
MAVYSSFSVGAAQGLFGTKYPPQYVDIGTSSGSWSFGILTYPAPFRSFSQAIGDATNLLGPYCRQLGGESGRLVISTLNDSSLGSLGYVQQCWYDFNDGPNATDPSGNLYPSKANWWGSSKTYVINVLDLMTEGHPVIPVEVAISSSGSDGEDSWRPFTPAYNIFNGLSAAFPLDLGNCGTGSKSGLPKYPFGDIGWTIFGIPSSLISALTGPVEDALRALANAARSIGVDNDSPVANGNQYSPSNLSTTISNLLETKKQQAEDFLDKLLDYLLEDNGIVKFKTMTDIITAVDEAADLFINGYYFPNLNYGKTLSNRFNRGESSLNPYNWRPSDEIQQLFAQYLLNNVNGSPQSKFGFANGHLEGYVPETTPINPNTGRDDMIWKLTLLNRGGGKTSTNPIGGNGAYVDKNTNEFVIPETYGFGRGGSIETSDNILNKIQQTFGAQVANSMGTLLDMSPGNSIFIVTILPIVELERLGRVNKESRGQAVNPVTNLDGLNDTYFDLRISAENLKKGNPTVYNYLVNSNQITAIP